MRPVVVETIACVVQTLIFSHVLLAAQAREFKGFLCWRTMKTVENETPKLEISAFGGVRRRSVSWKHVVEDIFPKTDSFIYLLPGARPARDRGYLAGSIWGNSGHHQAGAVGTRASSVSNLWQLGKPLRRLGSWELLSSP